jgi:hypothetical protein
MKAAAACLPVALALGSASAMAQAAGDPMDRLRACSTLADAERTKCLDRLSREIAPEAARPPAVSGSEDTATQDSWVVSETTSPIDYSPVVIATATARGAPDGPEITLAERPCGEVDRLDPQGVPRSHRRPQRGPPAPDPCGLRRLLPRSANASVIRLAVGRSNGLLSSLLGRSSAGCTINTDEVERPRSPASKC